MELFKSDIFAKTAKNIATNYKTCYMLGPWGWSATEQMIQRATTQGPNATKNKTWEPAARAIKNNGFIFDCVGLIKGILWGWTGDMSRPYGGAGYACNGVPDYGADQMIKVCPGGGYTDRWDEMPAGAVVWMSGHIGIYLGDGLCAEATPRWDGGVQISAVLNATKGKAAGLTKARTWARWGLLPYLNYDAKEPLPEPATPDTPSTWAAEAWAAAKAAGITDGTRPRDAATREQVITMLYRAGVIPND